MKTTHVVACSGRLLVFVALVHIQQIWCQRLRSPLKTNLVDEDSSETDLEDELEQQNNHNLKFKTPFKGWSEWSNWSPCSRTCDTGIRYQLRRCLGGKCQGKTKLMELCTVQECPTGEVDFRKQQCAQQNGKMYRKILYDVWQPVESRQEPCALLCRATTYEFTVKFQSKVVDGTRCWNDTKDVCVDGICVKVGCDNVLESGLKLDDCGICGGDGTTCGKPLFEWKNTYQFSDCDKTCGADSWKVSVSICVNRKTGKSVPEKFCGDAQRPRPVLEKCNHIPCPNESASEPELPVDLRWVAASWSECNTTCGGGSQMREVFCAEHYNSSLGVAERRKMSESYCWRHKKPDEFRSCNTMPCPVWEVGEWSECSVTCGKGVQRRRTVCRQDKFHDFNANACQQKNKPQESQVCYTGLSCEEAERNRLADYERYRYVAAAPFTQWDESSFDSRKGQLSSSHHPHWFPGQWTECSTTCGPGVKNRRVECVVLQPVTQNVMVWPAYECEGRPKPPEFEPCEIRQCPDALQSQEAPSSLAQSSGVSNEDSQTHRWEYGEFGPCSASCLGGTQYPTLKCVNVRTGQEDAWSNCDARQRLANFTKECNTHACPPRWETGPWSVCSHTCGGGAQTRQVRCIREMNRSRSTANTIILEDRQCVQPKPADRVVCAMDNCAAFWNIGKWQSCSATCGPGEQRRPVSCQQMMVGGETKTHDPPTPCSQLDRPPTVQVCNFGYCPTPVISKSSKLKMGPNVKNFEQTDGRRGLTLKIGGRAIVFEGTNVKIKCPVKNFDRNKLRWTKDDQIIKPNDKIRISKFGALRIFNGTSKDNGVYTCMSDTVYANMTLLFKALPQGQSNMNEPKGNEISLGSPSGQTINMGTDKETSTNTQLSELVVDPQPDSVEPLFNLKPGKQTSADADDPRDKVRYSMTVNTTKSGSVSLMEDLRNYLASNNLQEAYAALTRTNSISAVKFDWVLGAFSTCSQTCARDGAATGMQFRSVHCKVDIEERFGAYVPDDICVRSGKSKPHEATLCGVEPCPDWETGNWDRCDIARCVSYNTAIQRRAVYCAFPNGTRVNDTQCGRQEKPKMKKNCFNANCSADWRATEWSQCTKTCGDTGVKMRMLMCVWHGTKKPAGNSCNAEARPKVVSQCVNNPSCPKSNDLPGLFKEMDPQCEDTSKYCSVVKYMGKCSVADYNRQCCITCNYLADAKKR